MSTIAACPLCASATNVVKGRRAVTQPNMVRRHRRCISCSHDFYTLEAPEEAVLAEAFIIEWEQPVGGEPTSVTLTITDMVDDIAKIGPRLEQLTGRCHHPATIHHWKLHRAINGSTCEWRKEKVFPWP